MNHNEPIDLLEIVTVTRGNMQMKGVVALQELPPDVILCIYPGDREEKKKRNAFLATLTKEEELRHSTYDMMYPANEDYVLVPVDRQGNIKEEYINDFAIYINEASEVGEYPNVEFQEHRTNWDSIDVVTLKTIKAGEELLVSYGNTYERTWTVWWYEQELKKRKRGPLLEGLSPSSSIEERQDKLQKREEELIGMQKKLQRQFLESQKSVIATTSRKCVSTSLFIKPEIIDLTED
jgi:hypothetical protein